MQTTKDHIAFLWKKYLSDEASKAELDELLEYIESTPDDPVIRDLIHDGFVREELATAGFVGMDADQKINLLNNLKALNSTDSSPVVHRMHFLRRGWIKYAAAIIILFGIGTYLWTSSDKPKDQPVLNNKLAQTEILPGSNKATLTLSDGTSITLDSAANGAIAQQGNSSVIKLADGQVVYNKKKGTHTEMLMNTMTTPKGGQYQLMLPDGSNVWLNAASSITYPAEFAGKERRIKITGEAYLEVTKNKQMPFIVDVDGRSSVEVLGTSFNINSYSDEPDIKTTLLEGSVKVNGNITASNAGNKNSVILKPGQQAQDAASGIHISSAVDIVKIMAWKNGIFNFEGEDVTTVMRQLERWYDLSIQFKSPMPKITFKGKMYRNVTLSAVLDMLKDAGVKFELEGKTLIVM